MHFCGANALSWALCQIEKQTAIFLASQDRATIDWMLANLCLCNLFTRDSFVWKRNVFLCVVDKMTSKSIVDKTLLKGIWQLNYAKT